MSDKEAGDLRTADREGDWVVLLEVSDGTGVSTIDPPALRRLVAACGTPVPTSLFSADRYALQLQIRAPDAPSALASAIRRWSDAQRAAGLPCWDLVRAEVLTSAELERDLAHAEWLDDSALDARLGPGPAGVEQEDELLRRALFDPITGLPARALFLDELRQALVAPTDGGGRAVIVLHLDEESLLRPGPGCASGDDVLVDVAARLAAAVRQGDTVARVGDAEFALLVGVPSAEGAEPVARRILDSVACPASAGVAVPSCGCDADDLMLMAELAVVVAPRRTGRADRSRLVDGRDPV